MSFSIDEGLCSKLLMETETNRVDLANNSMYMLDFNRFNLKQEESTCKESASSDDNCTLEDFLMKAASEKKAPIKC